MTIKIAIKSTNKKTSNRKGEFIVTDDRKLCNTEI